jgi:hypothetical protein
LMAANVGGFLLRSSPSRCFDPVRGAKRKTAEWFGIAKNSDFSATQVPMLATA